MEPNVLTEVLKMLGTTGAVVLGIWIVSLTELVKAFLPDAIESKCIMAISLGVGLVSGLACNLLGIIAPLTTALISGTLIAGILTGSISFLFNLIAKIKE